MALLGSTQHRDVEVKLGSLTLHADKHTPGEISNSAAVHLAGGNRARRVLVGKATVEDGTLEFTLDPETDVDALATLTAAVETGSTITINDTYKAPGSGKLTSRSYNGVVSALTEPESDTSEANAMAYTVTYVVDGTPTTTVKS